MTRLLARLTPAAVLLVAALSMPVSAQVDLVVQKSDISVVKSTPLDATYVTVTVRNNGGAASGPFVLRIGASMAGAGATSDFLIIGVNAGQTASKAAVFQGTNWMCAWGNADVGETIAETSESNNCASANNYWIAVLPGAIHEEHIGVVNPGTSTETATLSASAPPDWIATVIPSMMTLGPGEFSDALVRIGVPSNFDDYAVVEVFCNFLDGTPGVLDWKFHVESAIPVEENTWGSIKALFVD